MSGHLTEGPDHDSSKKKTACGRGEGRAAKSRESREPLKQRGAMGHPSTRERSFLSQLGGRSAGQGPANVGVGDGALGSAGVVSCAASAWLKRRKGKEGWRRLRRRSAR